jgi:hypothetical protein
MSIPSWLYYLFGALMLAVAAYSATLLVLGFATRRPAGRDVELSHTFMGVAMAGMFVGDWAFGRSAVWEIIFALLMVWFIVASIQSVERFGLHLPHALIHAAMSFAMLLMYWFPMGAPSSGGSMSMSETAGGGHVDPGLASLLALILCASAVFTLASPVKGRSHFGSHAPAYAVGGGEPRSGTVGGGGDPPGALAVEETVAMPWLVDVSHAVMCVGMAFMLVLLT